MRIFRVMPISVFCFLAGAGGMVTGEEADSKMFSEVFEYGATDVREIKAALEQVLTDEGRHVFLYDRKKVLVQDVEEQKPLVEAVMKELLRTSGVSDSTGPNIRVEVSLSEGSQSRGGGIDVRGGIRDGDVRVDIGGGAVTRSRDQFQSQFLVVRSGGTASLQVVREVPMVDYFYSFARDGGLWTETSVRWERVGTELAIEPVWLGGQIRVTVWPRLTAWADGRRHAIDVRELATQVTVPEGRTVPIGGFRSADDRFEHYFFGGGRRGQTQSGQFTIRATRAQTFRTPAR